MLLDALTTRKTMTVGERLIVPYKLAEVSFYLAGLKLDALVLSTHDGPPPKFTALPPTSPSV